MFNKVTVVGRLTRDPQLKTSVNNKNFCFLTVACSNSFGASEKTDFIPVVCWNKVAENVAKYLAKGSLVLVDGYLTTRKGPTQNSGYAIDIVEVSASKIIFLDKKGARASNPSPSNSQPYSAPGANPTPSSFNQNNNSNNKAEVKTTFADDNKDSVLWD